MHSDEYTKYLSRKNSVNCACIENLEDPEFFRCADVRGKC